jgi:hypothetical protein
MNKTMKLGIIERVHLLNIIPRKGTILENKVIMTLLNKVEFDAKELKEYDLKSTEDGKISWNPEKVKEIEVSFLEAEVDMIKKAFKDLDGKKEVPLYLMPLIEKFE